MSDQSHPTTPPFSEGSGFTPGPWCDIGDQILAPSGANGDYRIADVYGPDFPANAQLIAAAPELYAAALCLPVHWLKQGILTRPTTDELRIEVRIVGTSYEAEMTVGDLRAAAAALSKSRASGAEVEHG